MAMVCGGLGIWLTPQWPVYVAGLLIGGAAVVLARGIPHALPQMPGPEETESSMSPVSVDASPARQGEPYDTGDKILVGLIAASLVGLLAAILWGG